MSYVPLRVSVPEPCHEDWNDMTPVDRNTRHCENCAKNVVDFSWMTDREVHRFVAASAGGLCGRFRRDQLNRPIRAVVIPLTNWRTVAAAGAVLLSAGVATQANTPLPPTDLPPVATTPVEVMGEVVATTNKLTFGGRVLDEAGTPLAGASIHVVGTSEGTITDESGRFALEVSPRAQLRISYLGYETLDLTLGKRHPGFGAEGIDLVLSETAVMLGEVDVVAGMMVLEPMVTGGISTVTVDEAALPPVACDAPPAAVSPNPFTDQLRYTFSAETAGTLRAELLDGRGRRVQAWSQRTHQAGDVVLTFSLRGAVVPAGTYVLRLRDQRGGVSSEIVVKQ